jgi:Uncharacterized protein conserved in bacteria (DUF2330)
MNRISTTCALALGALASLGAERAASACGGCFHPPTPPTQTASDITDERMLLSVSSTQTTLYDQIRYSGSPSSFAWVLPIKGTVDVGLSADVLFDSIDAMTETTIIAPTPNCPSPPVCNAPQAGYSSAGTSSASGAADAVTVLKQQNVGPYATVQLHATDSSALNDWLAQNGFDIPGNVAPVIGEYVTEGFDFLAMKLLPDQGVQSMRPVRVTSPGASLSLPLRMAAIGTGASVGITIWVVADGRYEPQNFPFFHIDDSALVWDFATNLSNYTTLRVQNEAANGNKGWEIESSIPLNEQRITNVITSGGQYFGAGNGGFGSTYVSDPTQDYLPVNADDGGVAQTAEQVREADISTLFVGMTGPTVRVTRMRSDIIHAAMTQDLLMRASSDQSDLSNVRTVTKSVNLVCPVYNGCAVVGSSSYGYGGGSSASSTSAANGSTGAGGSASGPPSGGDGGGGGCATTPNASPLGPLAIAGALGFTAILVSRRRKRT